MILCAKCLAFLQEIETRQDHKTLPFGDCGLHMTFLYHSPYSSPSHVHILVFL